MRVLVVRVLCARVSGLEGFGALGASVLVGLGFRSFAPLESLGIGRSGFHLLGVYGFRVLDFRDLGVWFFELKALGLEV